MEPAQSKGLVSRSDLIVFIKGMAYLFFFLSSVQLDWSPVLSSSSKRVKVTDTKKLISSSKEFQNKKWLHVKSHLYYLLKISVPSLDGFSYFFNTPCF